MPRNGRDHVDQRRTPAALVELIRRIQETVENTAKRPDGLRRYVGVAAGTGSLILAGLNVLDIIAYDSQPLSRALTHPSFVLLILTGAGWLVTGLLRNASLCWLQVLVFAVVSIVIAATSYPGNVTSAIFLILAITLAGEFARNMRILTIGVPVIIVLYSVALAFGYHTYGPDWLLGTWAALLVVLLLVALYGGVLIRHRAQHREAAELLESRVRDRTSELEKALAERVVMLQEIHHRVKNNLQIIASLLRLEANSLTDDEVRRPMETSIQRIHTMALVHESLYQSEELRYVELGSYTRELVRAVSATVDTPIRLDLVSDRRIEVDLDFAIPFGLLLNELVSSAVQQSFQPKRREPMTVRLRQESGLELVVEGEGAGSPADQLARSAGSLGLTLVESLVRQLHGRIEPDGRPGTIWRVSIPRSTTSDPRSTDA